MNGTVAVIGAGALAEYVCNLLAGECRLIRQLDLGEGTPNGADLALVLHEGWTPSIHAEAERRFRETATPWLRGFVWFGEGVVGPLVRPDQPGCSQCADFRKTVAGTERREMWMLREQLSFQDRWKRDAWASANGLRHMAHRIAEEARAVLQRRPTRTDDHLLLIHFITLTISRHRILPDPHCPVCGGLPDDSASGAAISLGVSPKTSPENYRSRALEGLKEALSGDYLDYRTGLLNGKMFDLQSPFADASVNLPMFAGDEGTAGRTHRYSDSVPTAILEGLERHCGVMPRGKKTVMRGSYRQYRAYALNPEEAGMHAPERYAASDFPFEAFDPDRDMDWVWGYSFQQERPILVPEPLAYYSTGCGRGFVYETSNGCALGGSREEAIFYGILEAVERDSFLLAWYAQLPLPRLDPGSGDQELRLMADRLQAAAGFEVLLYNATMEHGIPAIWSIAKNRTGRGVNLICAAGAHPDPVRAARSSIHELAAMLIAQNDKFEQNKATYRKMLDDPELVRQMEDHSMLYALPEAEGRLRFLLEESRPLRKFEEEFEKPDRHSDLTEELKGLIQALHRRHLDVIAVDQSGPETLRNGLHCVKVLIPGLLPMTFGYRLTRLTGLDRVLRVPFQLGYAQQPLTRQQINPHPHPFP